MQTLVTGATGFVGSAVVRRLVGRGDRVHALVRSTHQAPMLRGMGAEPFVADISDPNAIASAADDCDVIIHCAAVSSPRATPHELAWVNVAGTENVLNAATHVGCSRVVYLSCADVSLINCDRVHWKEDRRLPGLPLDAHGRTKLLAEELALLRSNERLGVTALRPSLLWGPEEPHLMPRLCREARAGGVHLFGNGANLVATTYIDNLIDAVLTAADRDEAAGHAFYITDNEFITAREFFSSVCTALGAPPPRSGHYWTAYALATLRERLGREGAWRGDVIKRGRSWLFDIHQATGKLDYSPSVDLEEGCRRLTAWSKTVGGYTAIASNP